MAVNILQYESARQSFGNSAQQKAAVTAQAFDNLAKSVERYSYQSDLISMAESAKAAHADIIQNTIDPNRKKNDEAYANTVLRNTMQTESEKLHAELDNPASQHSNMDPKAYLAMLQAQAQEFYKANGKDNSFASSQSALFANYTYKNQDVLVAKQAKIYKDNMKSRRAEAAIKTLTHLPAGEGNDFNLNTSKLLGDALPDDIYTTEERRNIITSAALGAAGTGDRRLLDYSIAFYGTNELNPVRVQQAEAAYTKATRLAEDKKWMTERLTYEKLSESGTFTESMRDKLYNDKEAVRRYSYGTIERWLSDSNRNLAVAQTSAEATRQFNTGLPMADAPMKVVQQVYDDAMINLSEQYKDNPVEGMKQFVGLLKHQNIVSNKLKTELASSLGNSNFTVESVMDPVFQHGLTIAAAMDGQLSDQQMIAQMGKPAWDNYAMWANAMNRTGGDPQKAADLMVAANNFAKDIGKAGGKMTAPVGVDKKAFDDAAKSIVNGDHLSSDVAGARKGWFGLTSTTGESIYQGQIRAELSRATQEGVDKGMPQDVALAQATKYMAARSRPWGNSMLFLPVSDNGEISSVNTMLGIKQGAPEEASDQAWHKWCETIGIDPEKAQARVVGSYFEITDKDGNAFEGQPVMPLVAVGALYETAKADAEKAAQLAATTSKEAAERDIIDRNRRFGNQLETMSGGDTRKSMLRDGTPVSAYLAASDEEKAKLRERFDYEKHDWLRQVLAPAFNWLRSLSDEQANAYDNVRTFDQSSLKGQVYGKSMSTIGLRDAINKFDPKGAPALKSAHGRNQPYGGLASAHAQGTPAATPTEVGSRTVDKQIQKHEGFRGKPYDDTVGVSTVGYGRNLKANPITPEEWKAIGGERDLTEKPLTKKEALVLYKNDVARAETAVATLYADAKLNDVRKNVLIDMAFNLGENGLKSLTSLKEAIDKEDWSLAADKMEGYKWYKQVGTRGKTLVNQMRKGK